MLIELTSKPWKESADSYPTVDATIDGKKDQFVQKHPDGSLWMSEMQASNQGTFVAFTPIPEDAMVIDLVNENCLGTVAKKAHELAKAGGNIDRWAISFGICKKLEGFRKGSRQGCQQAEVHRNR